MSQRDQLLRDKCEEESKNRKLQVEISQLNRDINGLKQKLSKSNTSANSINNNNSTIT